MLYLDLWLMIFEWLGTDKSSIFTLMAVSKNINNILSPLLYTTVSLHDYETAFLFCESMSLPLSSQRGNLVKRLSILPGYTGPSQDIAPTVTLVRSILRKLKNLEQLTLLPTTPFGALFRNLGCSFRLTHLTCACYPKSRFASFLRKQSSITDLDLRRLEKDYWGTVATVRLVKHCNRRLAFRLRLLPNLTSITGDSLMLTLLCAGRPINRVVVTDLLSTHGGALAISITRSTSSVRSLAIELDTLSEWRDSVLNLLDPLKSTPVASTLLDLRVLFDAVSTSYTELDKQTETYISEMRKKSP